MATVGQYLRELRDQRKMSVGEVSRATRVPMASVERIETDRFDELPGEVFVRGFLKSYARALSVPTDDVLARYTASRRVAWVTPLPISAPSKPARGRRLGRRCHPGVAPRSGRSGTRTRGAPAPHDRVLRARRAQEGVRPGPPGPGEAGERSGERVDRGPRSRRHRRPRRRLEQQLMSTR